jgi:transposase
MNSYRERLLDALKLNQYSTAKTAATLGISSQACRDAKKRLRAAGYHVPKDPDLGCPCGHQTNIDPTPEEIAAMCEQFRESWNEERKRRYEGPPAVVLHAHTTGRMGRERIYSVRQA